MPAADSTLRSTFQLGDFTVDPLTGHLAGPAGREQLDPKVMDVLVVLAEQAGQVVPRVDLLRRVWRESVVTDDALSRCIYQLRCHLRDAGGSDRCKALVETLPKRGYRLNCPPPTPVSASTSSDLATAPAPASHTGGRFAVWLTIAVAVLPILAGAGTWWLLHTDYFWNPLANARFSRLTDFDGVEEQAAISRDGSFVAFVSDRGGRFDVWLTRVGTGRFRNLTDGRAPELRNPNVRTANFSPDGTDVIFWTRFEDAGRRQIDLWAAPTGGGSLRRFVSDVAEVAWSSNRTRMAYHPPTEGDPLFVTEPNETVGSQIFVAPKGLHCHFPVWSPDDAFIYFVYGRPPDEMDVWRIAAVGGTPERITFHNSRVGYPVLLDENTLMYLATADDGSGPWLYAMDLERRVTHRSDFGLQPFTSLAATADGRRLTVTVTTPRESLWRVPIGDRVAEPGDAHRIEIRGLGGHSPRFARGDLLYIAPTDGFESLWTLSGGTSRELWNGRQGRVVAGAAVEPHGQRLVFPVALGGHTRLYLLDPIRSAVRRLIPDLDVQGAAAWSPDGKWIAVAADRGSSPQLFEVPLGGGRAAPIVGEYSIDPAFSPDGSFLVYRSGETGPSHALKAVKANGEPHAVPDLILPRGSNRFVFVPAGTLSAGPGLVVLKGELLRKNFWVVDLETGNERQLTDFGLDFVIHDFDVSADASEIVFDRVREDSDILLIELGE